MSALAATASPSPLQRRAAPRRASRPANRVRVERAAQHQTGSTSEFNIIKGDASRRPSLPLASPAPPRTPEKKGAEELVSGNGRPRHPLGAAEGRATPCQALQGTARVCGAVALLPSRPPSGGRASARPQPGLGLAGPQPGSGGSALHGLYHTTNSNPLPTPTDMNQQPQQSDSAHWFLGSSLFFAPWGRSQNTHPSLTHSGVPQRPRLGVWKWGVGEGSRARN